MDEINVGDWVSYEESYWNEVSFRSCTRPAAAKIVAIDGAIATIERCEMAKITRRAKAFGQRIDKTPYRWQWQVKRPLSELRLLHPSVARGLEQKRETVLRYPTKGERDYQRMKRRKAREKGASA